MKAFTALVYQVSKKFLHYLRCQTVLKKSGLKIKWKNFCNIENWHDKNNCYFQVDLRQTPSAQYFSCTVLSTSSWGLLTKNTKIYGVAWVERWLDSFINLVQVLEKVCTEALLAYQLRHCGPFSSRGTKMCLTMSEKRDLNWTINTKIHSVFWQAWMRKLQFSSKVNLQLFLCL